MVGLALAILFFLLSCAFGSAPAVAFLNASSFLFWWYTIITGLLFVTCLATITFIGTLASSQSNGVIGFLLGIFLGIIVGTILSVITIAKNLLLIIGSYLLYASVILDPLGPPAWSSMKLIIGAACLLIGLIATKWPKSN